MSTYGKARLKSETQPLPRWPKSAPEIPRHRQHVTYRETPDSTPIQREAEEKEDEEANQRLMRSPESSAEAAAGSPSAPRAPSRTSTQLDWHQLFADAFANSRTGRRLADKQARHERRWQRIDALVAQGRRRAEAAALQTKLDVSEPGDPLEREADQVADHVMSRPAPDAVLQPAASRTVVAREAEMGEKEDEEGRMPSMVQRACAECQGGAMGSGAMPMTTGGAQRRAGASMPAKGFREEEDEDEQMMMQREAGAGAPSAGQDFQAALGSVRAGGGEALPQMVRGMMEPRFGQDFSGVRVHRDAQAGELAEAVQAKAFTVGRDVFFKQGAFQPETEGGQRLLAHELTHVVQQREGMRSVQRDIVQKRHDDAPPVTTPPAQPAVQRQPEEPAEAEAAGGGLIVDDTARTLTRGQERKTQFIRELRAAVCIAADRELARAGRNTNGCPVIEKWLADYARRPATHLERAIRKFVKGASRVRSAREYIPLVAERVAQGVRTWVETGRIPDDLPPELRRAAMGSGLTAAIGGTVSAIGSAVSSAVSAVGSAIGGAVKAIGGLFFKEGPGGARPGADPAAVMSQLGAGRPLEATAQARMEQAFGQSFGNVRVHDDTGAASLSSELGAAAFAVGEHVAFSEGSYRPGTPIGDALLAHELAHVVQQGGGMAAPSEGAAVRNDPVAEHDADQAAAGAVASLYTPGLAPGRRPRVRTGLRLSRCSTEEDETSATQVAPTKAPQKPVPPAASATAPATSASVTPSEPKPGTVTLGKPMAGDDILAGFPSDQVAAWYGRLADATEKQGAVLGPMFLRHWLKNRDSKSTFKIKPHERIRTSTITTEALQYHRQVYLTEKKARLSGGVEKWAGVIPRLQGKKGFPKWDGTGEREMHYQGLAAFGSLGAAKFEAGLLSEADSDVFTSFKDFQLRTDVKVKGSPGSDGKLRIEFTEFDARALDRYDFDPKKHLTLPNPDFKSTRTDAIRPDLKTIKVYHTNAHRLQKDGWAAEFNIETEPWPVKDSRIAGPGEVDPKKSL